MSISANMNPSFVLNPIYLLITNAMKYSPFLFASWSSNPPYEFFGLFYHDLPRMRIGDVCAGNRYCYAHFNSQYAHLQILKR